ncbi:DUF4852 domain-containing protein [uncultured Pseudodesulfovibrio sp.]|uniref:DUF4852 domain-containing protein n=1 Tax=uncultured Pseudodesulfovibrio sp. TaxID=2035858 RepID=UPI0029C82229|nr:DUF4852 domain-containing protein [uncultured Pseudodesulfovibrio sp.]
MYFQFKSIAIVGCLILLSSIVANASASHRLAYSKKMGAEVFADQVDGAWCQDAVKIKVYLDDSSPLLKGGLESFLQKVGTVLKKDCGSVLSASFDVYKKDKKTLVSSYSSSSQTAWAIVQRELNKKDTEDTPKPVQIASKKVFYGNGFEGLFVNYFRFNLDQLDQNDYRWWARNKFGKEYRKVRRQEFKLNSLIEKSKNDFANTLTELDEDIVSLVVQSSIGNYDFDKQQFRLNSSLKKWNVQNPYLYEDNFYKDTVNNFVVEIEGADLLRDVVMAPALAEKFISRRTNKWDRVDRAVYVKINFEVDRASYSKSGKSIIVNGKLHSGTVYNTNKLSTEILSIENSKIESLLAEMKVRQEAAEKAEKERIERERIAAEAKRKEQEKKRFLAQKQLYIARLKEAPLSVRLASYLHEESLMRFQYLDSLANARAIAAINEKPVAVGMLVQMDEDGREKVETRWPGMLNINVSDESPELQSAKWYLVDGFLSVENNGKLESAELNVTHVHACQQDMCTDLADPTVIVDRYMKMKFSEGEN